MTDGQVNTAADPTNPGSPASRKRKSSGSSEGGGRTMIRNVRLSQEEYEKLNLIAEQCVMPVSSYIRAAALMQHVKSRVDQDAVREMSLANANLARLGNLLKLWISLDEDDPGHPVQQGTSVSDVIDLMGEIIEAKKDVQDKGAQLLRELS